MKLLLFAVTILMLTSCATSKYKCRPSKGSRDYALVKVTPTMIPYRGWNHVFVDGLDTVKLFKTKRWQVGKCYQLCGI